MTIQITGKNLDAGDALRSYILDRVEGALDKYLGSNDFSGHVRVEKERGNFLVHCSIQLWNGLNLQSRGSAPEAHAGVDVALERLEKQLRRYKGRIRKHHSNQQLKIGEMLVADYTVDASEDNGRSSDEHTPLVIAETQTTIHEFPVSDAVMHMDLSDQPFLVFRNAAHGSINVVYRRDDGNIGWIDPEVVSGSNR